MNIIKLIEKQIALIKELLAKLLELLKLKKEEEKNYLAFCLAVRKRESGDNYQIINKFGYLGAYQFGMARLCDLGYTERIPGTTGYANKDFRWKQGYSTKDFLDNPNFQDKIFREHVKDLAKKIKARFPNYLEKMMWGIMITLSGLIAGAHLGGLGGIKLFLETGQSSHDAYGTSVKSYIKKFGGYNLEL